MTPNAINTISPIIKELKLLISKKQYNKAINKITKYLSEALLIDDKDLIAQSLEILDAICDKTELTINNTLNLVSELIDCNDYWIRQDALNILKKMYPILPSGKFDFFVEKCESKLFDPDKKVRETAVGLISTILKLSFDTYPELYLTYCRMFDDKSWKVRAKALEGVLEFLVPNSNPSDEMVNALSDNLFNLFQDPDEEIRGLAAEVLKSLCFHMEPNKIVKSILLLLNSKDWEIREKGIWIIGEIGFLYYRDFFPIFKIMINLFSDDIMMIQTKTIDSFVKIGKKKSTEIETFFLDYLEKHNVRNLPQDAIDGISESLIFIILENMKDNLPVLIRQLHNPKEEVRNIYANCLQKIYLEKPDLFEEELYLLFQSLNPNDWRQRKELIMLFGDLSYVLHIQSIAVWTAINLKNWQNLEKDLDVLDEIENSLIKIKNIYSNIDEEIKEVDKRKNEFYIGLDRFHRLASNLRSKCEQMIYKKKFSDAELFLEEESNKISEKMDNFEHILHESEFKRFSVEVIQDFKDIKDEILENISDIKSVMFNQICDGRSEYIEELTEIIKLVKIKIDNIKEVYITLKDLQKNIEDLTNPEEPNKIEEFLDKISKIRENVFKMEFEIGQTWINNLEFKEFLKEITIYWVEVKIEVQQFLGDIVHKFTKIHHNIKSDDEHQIKLKKKITYDFLNSNLHNVILQAVQNQRDVVEGFNVLIEPIYQEIRKKKFKNARYLVDITLNKLYSSIENYNKEINQIYNEIDQINIPADKTTDIREYINNWNDIKGSLLEKIHIFENDVDNEIFIEEIKEYLKYMNPIPLEKLSNKLSIELEKMKEKLLVLIEDKTINAVIRGNDLIQPEKPHGENLLFFSRKVDIIGTKINFNLRIYNPTKFFISNIKINFLYPQFMIIQQDGSDPTELYIKEFEPEAIRVTQWNFKLEKLRDKKYELKKWLLNVSYKNPFNKIVTFQKEMEIIL